MNFADIQKTWQSPQNTADTAELEKQKMEMIQTLHRRDRGFVIGMTLILAGLVVMTFMILRNEMIGGTPDTIDVRREWSALLFFGLPWVGAIWVLIRYRRMLRQQGEYARSIAAGVRALLEQNRFSQAKARMLIGLQVLGLPVMALVIQQLQNVGKMRPHEAASAAVLMGAAMLFAIGCQTWEYFRKLKPEQKRLENLLASYEAS